MRRACPVHMSKLIHFYSEYLTCLRPKTWGAQKNPLLTAVRFMAAILWLFIIAWHCKCFIVCCCCFFFFMVNSVLCFCCVLSCIVTRTSLSFQAMGFHFGMLFWYALKKDSYIASSQVRKSESLHKTILIQNMVSHTCTEEVTKSGSLLPLGKNSLLSKIGDQRCDRKCYL